MRVRLAAVIVGALLAAACTDPSSPGSQAEPDLLAHKIEGHHGTNGATDQYLFWLPPVFGGSSGWHVANVTGLAPEVQIFECIGDETDACSSLSADPVADLTSQEPQQRWQSPDHYLALWKTDRGLDAGTYRVCVALPGDGGDPTYLGHADVQVVNPRKKSKHDWGRYGDHGRGREAIWGDAASAVVAGSTLPIKFKIGDGYADATSDEGCSGGAPAAADAATLSGLVQVVYVPALLPSAAQANIAVTVFDGTGTQVASATTDGSGQYSIGSLVPGEYTVCATKVTGGDLPDATGTCPTGSMGYLVTVVAGANTQDFDFAILVG